MNIYMNIFGDTIKKKKSNQVTLSLKAGGRGLNENPDFFLIWKSDKVLGGGINFFKLLMKNKILLLKIYP